MKKLVYTLFVRNRAEVFINGRTILLESPIDILNTYLAVTRERNTK